MSLHEFGFGRNPLDMIEQVAAANDWAFERPGEDEISILVTGIHTNYTISFSWLEEMESLHLACSFGMRVTRERLNEVLKLISVINQQLVVGHFDLWFNDGAVVFRQALPLNGGVDASDSQIEFLLASALDACEQYYQAFQFVVWAGKSAEDALEDVLFETMGEA